MRLLAVALLMVVTACSQDDGDNEDDVTTDLTTGWDDPDADGDDTGAGDADADGGADTGL